MAAMHPFSHVGVSNQGRCMADVEANPSVEKTTLMLRGFPRSCAQKSVMRKLAALAGGMCFDFFYLPWDRKKNTNMRFAFVNCVDARVARELLDMVQSQKISFQHGGSPRAITGMFAHVQGLMLNIAHYIGSALVQEENEHAPVIMHEGRRLTFQDAVRKFVPPELAASLLREAKWKARSSYAPPAWPQDHPGQSKDALDGGSCTANGACMPMPSHLAPPMALPMPSHLATPMALHGQEATFLVQPGASTEATEAERMKDAVLHSDCYARAWRRLNLQLTRLQSKFGNRLVQ